MVASCPVFGGVLGVALYTEQWAARAGVMAADLGTSVLARAACLGEGPGAAPGLGRSVGSSH